MRAIDRDAVIPVHDDMAGHLITEEEAGSRGSEFGRGNGTLIGGTGDDPRDISKTLKREIGSFPRG
jgi:hypothetical protein